MSGLVFTHPWRARSWAILWISVLSTIILSTTAFAQGQLVTESNLIDAILERETFLPIELNALDLNRDGVVDIADLTFHAIVNSNFVPSVSFGASVTKTFEGPTVVSIEVVSTEPFDADQEIQFSLSGTAKYGTKASGGDYTVAGYDAGTEMGIVTIPAGSDSTVISVTLYDDADLDEGTEYVSFMLKGGGVDTYFLGARQLHGLYIDDNDGKWTVGIELPDGERYESFEMEIIQEEGVFDGRVLSDTKLIAPPEQNDVDARGDDGWDARFYTGDKTLRIELGPLPVAKSLSLFDVDRTLSYVLDVNPSVGNYVYDPNREMSGAAMSILTPVKSRLGDIDQRHIYLLRESSGTFTMLRKPSNVEAEPVVLTDAP